MIERSYGYFLVILVCQVIILWVILLCVDYRDNGENGSYLCNFKMRDNNGSFNQKMRKN